jgi:hypothetical protein
MVKYFFLADVLFFFLEEGGEGVILDWDKYFPLAEMFYLGRSI